MKKLLLIILIFAAAPLLSFAHAGEDSTGNAQHGENHEEMETLMKKMMVEGTLSEQEADRMITMMNESQSRGDMSGMMGIPLMGGMMNDFSGGMFGYGFVPLLFLITTGVWLLVGIFILIWLFKKIRTQRR